MAWGLAWRRGARWAAGAALASAAAAVVFVLWPLPEGLLGRRRIAAVRFTDRDGALLREVPSPLDDRGIPLPVEAPIPPRVERAFLAAEDRRFGHHPGVDPLALARAVGQNLRAGRVVSGASTIPQQLARLLVPRSRTLPGKVKEALWAIRLTAHLGRDELLREYLDRVALGHDLRGVEAASRAYFGRPAAALTTGQAALLAGLVRGPASADPWRALEAARGRQRMVLGRIVRAGWLDPAAAHDAAEAPLDLTRPKHAFRAPHLVTWLNRELASRGVEASEVETTIDPVLQAEVETILRDQVRGDPRLGQAAAIVVDNRSGEILAYAGSVDFLDEARLGQNDGVRTARQPGSALKPFAYGLALASGWTPASLLSDVELHLGTPGGDWIPRNYDRRVHGPVRLRVALASSYNVPAVRLAEALGPERILEVLHAAGFASLTEGADHYGAGLVLGNGSVTLLELARAYRGLALEGRFAPLVEVRRARDASGREQPLTAPPAPRQFLPRDAVRLLTDLLSDDGARAPAFGLDHALRFPFPVAAKTGTSHAFVDNWTAGFSSEVTVAVWVGNFDGRPMRGISGITGAGPIFNRIMNRAMRGRGPGRLVDRGRFEHRSVCALSGRLAGRACPSTVEEVFLPGSAPALPCSMHRWEGRAVLDVGPAYQQWALAEGLHDEPGGGESPGDEGAGAGFLLPRPGDQYLLEAGIPDGAQVVPVRVRPPSGERLVEVRIDDGAVLRLGPPFVGRIEPRPGRHHVELWLPGGTAPLARSDFTVVGAAR
jgi:penicillin-binding protein 1C